MRNYYCTVKKLDGNGNKLEMKVEELARHEEQQLSLFSVLGIFSYVSIKVIFYSEGTLGGK